MESQPLFDNIWEILNLSQRSCTFSGEETDSFVQFQASNMLKHLKPVLERSKMVVRARLEKYHATKEPSPQLEQGLGNDMNYHSFLIATYLMVVHAKIGDRMDLAEEDEDREVFGLIYKETSEFILWILKGVVRSVVDNQVIEILSLYLDISRHYIVHRIASKVTDDSILNHKYAQLLMGLYEYIIRYQDNYFIPQMFIFMHRMLVAGRSLLDRVRIEELPQDDINYLQNYFYIKYSYHILYTKYVYLKSRINCVSVHSQVDHMGFQKLFVAMESVLSYMKPTYRDYPLKNELPMQAVDIEDEHIYVQNYLLIGNIISNAIELKNKLLHTDEDVTEICENIIRDIDNTDLYEDPGMIYIRYLKNSAMLIHKQLLSGSNAIASLQWAMDSIFESLKTDIFQLTRQGTEYFNQDEKTVDLTELEMKIVSLLRVLLLTRAGNKDENEALQGFAKLLLSGFQMEDMIGKLRQETNNSMIDALFIHVRMPFLTETTPSLHEETILKHYPSTMISRIKNMENYVKTYSSLGVKYSVLTELQALEENMKLTFQTSAIQDILKMLNTNPMADVSITLTDSIIENEPFIKASQLVIEFTETLLKERNTRAKISGELEEQISKTHGEITTVIYAYRAVFYSLKTYISKQISFHDQGSFTRPIDDYIRILEDSMEYLSESRDLSENMIKPLSDLYQTLQGIPSVLRTLKKDTEVYLEERFMSLIPSLNELINTLSIE